MIPVLINIVQPKALEHLDEYLTPAVLTITTNRIEFGLVGGTAVSNISGNLLDLESDLRGTTHLQSKCPTYKYQNPCPAGDMTTCQLQKIIIRDSPTSLGLVVSTKPIPLPTAY